jgi:hypothetical protein
MMEKAPDKKRKKCCGVSCRLSGIEEINHAEKKRKERLIENGPRIVSCWAYLG